jgi:NADH:ubiquinone oxidoreductase subunit 2 (subunit N)
MAINTNSAIKYIAYGTWSSSLINDRSQFLYIYSAQMYESVITDRRSNTHLTDCSICILELVRCRSAK